MEIGRSLRATRAAVFAAACVSVSAAGHAWMSESEIPAWALLVAVLTVGGAGYALAGRQRGFAAIAGLMLTGELGLHMLFATAQSTQGEPMSSSPGMPGMGPMPGMIMPHPVPASAWLCGGGAADASDGPGALSSMPWMFGHGSAGMIAVHVAAGLLCARWLQRGEAATFRLLRVLAQLALPLLVVVWPDGFTVADLTAGVPDERAEHASTRCRLLGHALVRRGPPAPVFCM